MKIASPDGALTALVAVGLVVALAARNELPVAPTPPPPPLTAEITGASVGTENDARGPFWTIDTDAATLTVANTASTGVAADIAFQLLDGPCGAGTEVHITGPATDLRIEVPAGGSVPVILRDVPLEALSRSTLELEPTEPRCPPVGADPRSIAFQIVSLSLTP